MFTFNHPSSIILAIINPCVFVCRRHDGTQAVAKRQNSDYGSGCVLYDTALPELNGLRPLWCPSLFRQRCPLITHPPKTQVCHHFPRSSYIPGANPAFTDFGYTDWDYGVRSCYTASRFILLWIHPRQPGITRPDSQLRKQHPNGIFRDDESGEILYELCMNTDNF